MKKETIFILLFFIFCFSYAQKQTAFWYFGDLAGLDFNSGNPIALTNSQLTTNEGCAAISNYNGELLLYTDGVTVWNKNHEVMQNGENLNGDFSSTNSAIVIPKPESTGIYYIFTVDDLGGANGLQYSEVNMALNSGIGAVTSNKNITLHTPTTEKITAVKHQNDVDWWVLSHRWNSDEFLAYLVTNSGISTPVTSSIGTFLSGSTANTVGAMKFSPNGRLLAIANSYENNQVQLFNFNNATGKLTNPNTLTGFTGITANSYGIEFSLDSKLLYVSDRGGILYQYNTQLPTENEIKDSKTIIATSITGLGALQLAPNGKIYVAKENQNYLGVINDPNVLGLGCNYTDNGMFLAGRRSKLGLPPFIQSYFWKEVLVEFTCYEQSTQFTIVNPEVSQIWNFDDPASGVNNTSTLSNPTHIFSSPGTYAVEVESTNFLGESAITVINVVISIIPTSTTPNNYYECDNNLDGDSNNGVVQNFLLNTKDSEILEALDPQIYDVLYFEDIDFIFPINKFKPYENIIPNNQTVYAKIINRENDTCFDSVYFNLVVNLSPGYELITEKTICSNNLPDEIRVENPHDTYRYEWVFKNDLTQTIVSDSEVYEIDTIDFIPSEGITIVLTAHDTNTNCSISSEVFIQKFSPIKVTSSDIEVVDLSNNNTIKVNPSDPNFNIEDYEFALDNGYDGKGFYQDQPYFENVAPGIRTIYFKDRYGCNTFEIKVPVIGFRKFFTPNNDGENDTWHILGVNINFYATSTIHIYDRFGKIVANIHPQSDGWDGLYNNKELPESDYWFTVELVDNNGNIRNHKGHFSLIRR